MIEVPGWVILNFFTSILLILLLIFQNQTSRLQRGRKYSAILSLTLFLLFSETIGRIGELHPDNLLILAKLGYFFIFLLDPVDILFAVSYVDCWMDSGNSTPRTYFKSAFQVFAATNAVLVTISVIFNLRWFFYFENNVYMRGPYFMIRAIMLMVFIILLVVYAAVFRNDFMSEYKNMIMFLPVMSLAGALLQVFLANIDTTYGGISLGCLIIFFFFQSKDVNIDYLTGVMNRRGLDIRMEEKIKSSVASGREFTAIMMDIDNFKTINDTFGHEEGDRAIKCVAAILVDIFGNDSSIGRFGGDEFCIITDNISRLEIDKMLGEVHERLNRAKDKYGWDCSVDVSSGYEVYDPVTGMNFEKFTERIDKLMYSQKQIHHMIQKDG